MREFIPDPIPAVRFMIAGDVMNNAVSIGLAGREVGRVDEGDIFLSHHRPGRRIRPHQSCNPCPITRPQRR